MNIVTKFFIFLSLFSTGDSLVINPILYKNDNHNMLYSVKNNNKATMFLKNDFPESQPYSLTLLDNFLDTTIKDTYLGKIIVETISAQLPNVDSIGHNVLHANNEFINYILNDTNLSEIMKKNIVLASIQLAIMGDNLGSVFLQLYYDIVDKCL
tara:strand:+ start:11719 stop:12180 length:462 start_codon:yes stop_codon:yes gene_type:complete